MSPHIHADSYVTDEGWSSEPAPSWTERAACAEVDPELFYPEKGANPNDAKMICASCPVRRPCLEAAVRSIASTGGFERFGREGVWGGLTFRERQKLTSSGWKAGDPLPPVRTSRNIPGPCPRCGKTTRSIERHVSQAHPECAA